MRVATFNILHGVPLRDVPAADRTATTGPRRRRRTRTGGPDTDRAHAAAIDPAFDGAQLGEPLETLPDDADPAAISVGGADPTRRIQWSPPVSDPGELLRAVEELQQDGPLDVVALQEVDLRQPRTRLVDQAAAVADAIGARYWRFVPAVLGIPGIAAEGADWRPATEDDDDPPLPATTTATTAGRGGPSGSPTASGRTLDSPRSGAPTGRPESPRGRAADDNEGPRYGVALISRYPVSHWRVRRFPPAPMSMPLLAPTTGRRPRPVRVADEPRAAVAAVVEAPNADLTIATAHLSFVPGYNTRQLLELRAFLAGMPRPMVLLGDFNTPGGVPGLVTGWDQIARVPTYPVLRPRVQFDHIMADGWTDDALTQARNSARAVPLPVSDHCALVAEFPDP